MFYICVSKNEQFLHLSVCHVLSSLSQWLTHTNARKKNCALLFWPDGPPNWGLFLHLSSQLRGWEADAATILFFWPPHGIFILAWRSGLGKRPSDDHHHHSLRGGLAQCKPSMSSTVRTFFGVKQLRSPPSRPQSGYVCQRQTTKVKDKIQTHCTYKEWRHKELGWPSSPQQQKKAPPNILLFFGTKSLKIR